MLRPGRTCSAPSCSIFSQTVFLTIEEWTAHKLGLLHPAEAAALQAADDAWTGGQGKGRSESSVNECGDAGSLRVQPQLGTA